MSRRVKSMAREEALRVLRMELEDMEAGRCSRASLWEMQEAIRLAVEVIERDVLCTEITVNIAVAERDLARAERDLLLLYYKDKEPTSFADLRERRRRQRQIENQIAEATARLGGLRGPKKLREEA